MSGFEKPSRDFFCSKQTNEFTLDGIYLMGFEFDGTACFRKGARLGPNAIRDVSEDIESYSPYLNKDLEDINFFDIGNLPTDNYTNWEKANTFFEQNAASCNLKKCNLKLITLGGEHSVPYAMIKKYLQTYPDLFLLHLDAHADLRDGYEGYHYSHASIIRRVLEHFGPEHSLLQYGIRSGTKEEFKWMEENGTRANSLQEVIEHLPTDRPIYLTLDIDYFDPAYVPGTGTPEAGGESFSSFITLIKKLSQLQFVGADLVELAPELDPTGNSSVFAATLVREMVLAMHR